MSTHIKYLILGGGVGAGYACQEFVTLGVSSGQVGIISADEFYPYERPALTKAFLHPPQASNRARLPGFYTSAGSGGVSHGPEWYEQHGIKVFTNTVVTEIDINDKILTVDNGNKFSYDFLLFGAGSSAKSLKELNIKNCELENIFYIRLKPDAEKVLEKLENDKTIKNVLIIGGGYIGMETAAVLAGWNKLNSITLVFSHHDLMSQLLPKETSDLLQREFNAHGITLINDSSVTGFVDRDGKVCAAVLDDEKVLNTDLVIAGLGAKPNTELLKGKVEFSEDGGIKVDKTLKSSNDSVYVFGDLASFPYKSGHVRFEHVDNARNSAITVARNLVSNKKVEYNYTPFFYSRMFEYCDNPLIFNFYGDTRDKKGEKIQAKVYQHETKRDKQLAVWVEDDRIVGVLLLNGEEQEFNNLKKTAEQKPIFEDDPKKILPSW